MAVRVQRASRFLRGRMLMTAPQISSGSSSCSPIIARIYMSMQASDEAKENRKSVNCSNKQAMNESDSHRVSPSAIQHIFIATIEFNHPFAAFLIALVFPFRLHSFFEQMIIAPQIQRRWRLQIVEQTASGKMICLRTRIQTKLTTKSPRLCRNR